MHTCTHRSASLDRGARSQLGPRIEESTSTQDRRVNRDGWETQRHAQKHACMHKNMHNNMPTHKKLHACTNTCTKTCHCLLQIAMLFLLLHQHYHRPSMHAYMHAHTHASKCQPRPRIEESTWTQDRGVNLDPGSRENMHACIKTRTTTCRRTKSCMHAQTRAQKHAIVCYK